MARHLARFTLLVLGVVLLTVTVQARKTTDVEALQALSAKFQANWEAMRGDAYQQLLANPTAEIQQILDDPNLELMGVREDGTLIVGRLFNADAAMTTRTNHVQPGGIAGYDLDGSTLTGLFLWDGGHVQSSHVEFGTGRVTFGDGEGTDGGHATHVAGTMIASGVNPDAKGMATGASLVSYGWNNDLAEMADAAANEQILVSGHSYGLGPWQPNLQGGYDEWASGHDDIAYNAPHYLIHTAAGNFGATSYGTVFQGQTGKNVLCIANVEDVVPEYDDPSDVLINNSSSVGPTNDGRLKPEISANGTELLSSTNTSGYSSYTGTSMATPNTSGSSFLLYELYTNTHGELPLSTTIKAVILNTADEAGPAPGPDYKYGYGLMNTRAAADLIDLDAQLDPGVIVEAELENQETESFYYSSDGSTPIEVTIAWLEPSVPPNTVETLVNDLDIRLESLSDDTVYEPWLLDGNNPSAPATTGDNTVDNTEQIFVAAPTPGPYIVHVTHKATLQQAPVTYSVAVTGLTSGDAPDYILNLNPVAWYVMPDGGPVNYYVNFIHNVDQTLPGLMYWTTAVTPGGQTTQPLMVQNFTATPFMNVNVYISIDVPGWAPGGVYTYNAFVGDGFGNPFVTDSFEIVKFNPGDWGAAEGGDIGPGDFPVTTRRVVSGEIQLTD